MAYTKTTWVNESSPAISADNLNKMEAGIYNNDASITTINSTLSSYADYVVEQGTSGIWTYRKWNSGIMECWGTYSASISITTSSAGYGGYRSGSLSVPTFPVTYTNDPTITATSGGGGGYWVNNVTPSTTGGTFYLSCGASLSASTKVVHFHVIGS